MKKACLCCCQSKVISLYQIYTWYFDWRLLKIPFTYCCLIFKWHLKMKGDVHSKNLCGPQSCSQYSKTAKGTDNQVCWRKNTFQHFYWDAFVFKCAHLMLCSCALYFCRLKHSWHFILNLYKFWVQINSCSALCCSVGVDIICVLFLTIVSQVYQNYACKPSSGCYYPPTLITNVQPVSKIVIEEVSKTCLSSVL